MSEKREVLKVLDSDLREKTREIEYRWRPRIDAAQKQVDREKESITRMVRTEIAKAVKRFGATLSDGKRHVIDVGFTPEDTWQDVMIDSMKHKGLVAARAALEVAETSRANEINNLHQRASAIRRHIALHGVDPEVLELLAGL